MAKPAQVAGFVFSDQRSRNLPTMIITIDGPAGSGKSTLARALANSLGFGYLDSGAMYRCVALKAIEADMGLYDSAGLGVTAAALDFSCEEIDGVGERVMVGGADVTDRIREPDVSRLSSKVAAIREVRDGLVGLQRSILSSRDYVTEGRDMGTVVVPDADLKIFLVADPAVRAQRRAVQLQEKGHRVEEQAVEKAITKRDTADETRAVSPLKPAADAVEIDTTDLTVEQAVELVADLVKERR